jgi:hypothetical protein
MRNIKNMKKITVIIAPKSVFIFSSPSKFNYIGNPYISKFLNLDEIFLKI